VVLPGYPVSCVVNAVQFLCPAVKRSGRYRLEQHPSTRARLGEKVSSEPGVRNFVRVRVEESGGTKVALPTRSSGAGVLSSVTSSNGWLTVPENHEGIDEGEIVTVERWEGSRW
ncbi:MAG: molybdopterin molybdenumtransferase MoeA, partial [Halobacteria archaeon]|nr:molybdopterin molybdenumtransferase MoeA [Halobacteria archaeon]